MLEIVVIDAKFFVESKSRETFPQGSFLSGKIPRQLKDDGSLFHLNLFRVINILRVKWASHSNSDLYDWACYNDLSDSYLGLDAAPMEPSKLDAAYSLPAALQRGLPREHHPIL